jgi:hypothetical protein
MLVDSLNKQYDIRISSLEQEIASTADTKQRLALERQLEETIKNRKADLETLNRANAQSLNDIVSLQQSLDPKVFSDALKAAIDARYEGNEAMAVIAKGILDQINQLENSEFKTTLQLQLASGDLSPTAAARILEMKETVLPVKFNMTASAMGIANASQLLQLLIAGRATNDQVIAEFNIAANIKDPEEFDRRLEAINQLSQVPTEYGLKVSMTGQNIGQVISVVRLLKDEPESISYQRVLELEEANPGVFQGIIDNWNTITGGASSIRKEIIFDFKSVSSGGGNLISQYLQSIGVRSNVVGDLSKLTPDQYNKLLATATSYFIGGGKSEITPETDPTTDPKANAGAPADNPLDDILNKLRLVRDASIKTKGGLAELLRAMKDGSKATTQFVGVEQKLLFQGYGKDFVDAVMAMDEGTRRQFVTVKNGIVKVTDAGKALAQTFREITLGEYQVSLTADVAAVNAQITAMTKLKAAGLSLADSSEIAQDKQLALAIAHATNEQEVQKLIDAYRRLKVAEDRLMLSTPEGRQREFQAVASEATAYFSAQEEFYNQQYESGVKAYEVTNEIIKAQRDLTDKEFKIDDLQYALDQISEKESKINDEYDKREEAIENIFKANKAVLDQDKEKLDIAGALASGDLASAAKAMRAQTVANLERNKEAQINNLQIAREAELAKVRSASGKSRVEIEKEIRDLEKQIVEIQEKKLEPYQQEIERLDRIRQDALKDVSNTGFLGLTQSRWETIANEIERARFNVTGYANELKQRLSALGFTINADGSVGFASTTAAAIVNPNTAPPADPNAAPAPTPPPAKTETQKQIEELNRRIAITRWRVNNEKLSSAQKDDLMQLNIKRIKEVQRLGGTPDMTGQVKPGASAEIVKLAPGFAAGGYVAKYMRMGGLLPYKAEGGTIFAPMGTDTVPAMLTPGEFVVRRHAVSNFGVDRLKAINSGTYKGDSMYNYSVSVNVKSEANPDEIARSVMTQIKRIDSQRIRGNRF